MKNILEVKNLSVSLGNEKIISNLSFSAKKGDFLTVIGPNGSGKTVLLKTLLSLIPKQTGKIIWQKNVKLGYLPQGLTQLSVQSMPLTVNDFFNLKNINKDKILKLLKQVGLKDDGILNKKMGDLSGGQFQRILMIWALSNNPDVLLFDEPTTGIDMSGEQNIYKLLHDLQKNKKLTIILITHDLNVVYKHSNNVLCMSKNNSCNGTPEEISPEVLQKIYQIPIKFYKHHH